LLFLAAIKYPIYRPM